MYAVPSFATVTRAVMLMCLLNFVHNSFSQIKLLLRNVVTRGNASVTLADLYQFTLSLLVTREAILCLCQPWILSFRLKKKKSLKIPFIL